MATQPELRKPALDTRLSISPLPAGSNDNGSDPVQASHWLRNQSCLPEDAVAIIEPDPLSGHPGRARRHRWRIRFRARSRPFADPLTGWTGGTDPLANLVLDFPTREAAERYCRRLALAFESRPTPKQRPIKPALQAFEEQALRPLCCWPTGPHALCCGNFPILKP